MADRSRPAGQARDKGTSNAPLVSSRSIRISRPIRYTRTYPSAMRRRIVFTETLSSFAAVARDTSLPLGTLFLALDALSGSARRMTGSARHGPTSSSSADRLVVPPGLLVVRRRTPHLHHGTAGQSDRDADDVTRATLRCADQWSPPAEPVPASNRATTPSDATSGRA